jgi:predicted PurR-regulated permease PerM
MRLRRIRLPQLTQRQRPQTPTAPLPLAGGRPVAPVVVPHWIQLVVLPIALLGLWALARASGSVLLVLIFACVLALILNPIVKFLQRGMPRGIAILGVYLLGIAVVALIGLLLSNPVSTQVNHFADNLPHLVRRANRELDSVQRFLTRNGIKVQIEKQGQTALQTIQHDLEKSSSSIVSFSQDLLGKLVTFSIDFVLTIVLSVYLLVYAPSIGGLVRRLMPPGNGTPEDDYPLLVQKAVSGYVRGQLLFSTIMGTSAGLLLWLFGVTGVFHDGSKYAFFFGAFYGIAELIPYIGPIIGPIPALIVALLTNPISAVWVLIMFVGLQQLEGHLVAPQIFRISLRINPILVILSLLIGYQIFGVAGALIALPIAAIVRQTVLYLRKHLVLEPWTTVVPNQVSLAYPDEFCPDCGAARASGDAFCRSCGAALAARDEVTAYRETD